LFAPQRGTEKNPVYLGWKHFPYPGIAFASRRRTHGSIRRATQAIEIRDFSLLVSSGCPIERRSVILDKTSVYLEKDV
jgi:hypothetical protein